MFAAEVPGAVLDVMFFTTAGYQLTDGFFWQ
jgi:hypothetical protein